MHNSYFVEGLQGSGKSTTVNMLSEKHKDWCVYREGDYSPVELAWCAYVNKNEYSLILEKYSSIKEQIEKKTFFEDDMAVVCYTKINTDISGFYEYMEQYEIYNGRVAYEDFRRILLNRYSAWNEQKSIFECSLFQNTTEDMILFRNASDDEIISLYRDIAKVLDGKDFHIVYIKTDNIAENLDIIRSERSDDKGNEVWFNMLCGFFDNSLYAKNNGVSGAEGIISHWKHRQELELRICREVFDGKYTVLRSKSFDDIDI